VTPARIPALLLSRTAAQLVALADPDRLDLLATVLRRERDGEDCSLGALAGATGTPVRLLARQVGALEAAGLLGTTGLCVSAHLPELRGTATALLDTLPVVALLAEEPDLARFFVHGRLPRLPVLNRAEERRWLAALLVRLLPDRVLTEREVGAVLAEVTDDVAALRRFLVEEGRLTRRGAEDYRVVAAPVTVTATDTATAITPDATG